MIKVNYLSGQTHKQTLRISLQQQALRLKELDHQLAVKSKLRKFNACELMFKNEAKEIKGNNDKFFVKDLKTTLITEFSNVDEALTYFENNV